MPATELMDQVIETDAVWGAAANDLHQRLLEQLTPEAKFQALEKFLLRVARGRLEHSAAVRHSLGRFMAVPHHSNIRRVAAELGISHKHFILPHPAFPTSAGANPTAQGHRVGRRRLRLWVL